MILQSKIFYGRSVSRRKNVIINENEHYCNIKSIFLISS